MRTVAREDTMKQRVRLQQMLRRNVRKFDRVVPPGNPTMSDSLHGCKRVWIRFRFSWFLWQVG
jgi:hypothetical protein